MVISKVTGHFSDFEGKIEAFGATFNKTLETGGLVVGDEVEIILEIEAVKAK